MRTRSKKRAWMLGTAAMKLAVGWTLFNSGCSSSTNDGATATAASTATYYKDVKPIVDAKCTPCHTAGGIAPFPLLTYADVKEHAAQIGPEVSARIMPPWPPAQGCTDYVGDRSLPQPMIDTLVGWTKNGTLEGDPKDFAPLATTPTVGLSRIDRKLKMPAAFTPSISPDEYRCFLLDWPDATTDFVTGLGAVPGTASIVHHLLVFLAPPDQVATYQAYDDADPGPGYDCFGGPYPNASKNATDAGAPTAATQLPHLLGGWAPGALGADFPAGTGLRVDPGSKIVLQVHYNTLNAPPAPDLSEIDLKIDPSVTKEAHVMPWTNPTWPRQHAMPIPANDPDATYSFAFDGVTAATQIAGLTAGQPFDVWSAALHMHLHGTRASIAIDHGDGTSECMLDIERWNFHWQGSFAFAKPKTVSPGDALRIECHWDNTEANQPVIDGQTMTPEDLNWGEGTTDEMCLGFLYVTQ